MVVLAPLALFGCSAPESWDVTQERLRTNLAKLPGVTGVDVNLHGASLETLLECAVTTSNPDKAACTELLTRVLRQIVQDTPSLDAQAKVAALVTGTGGVRALMADVGLVSPVPLAQLRTR